MRPPGKPGLGSELIDFAHAGGETESPAVPPQPRTMLTGEVVEAPDFSAPSPQVGAAPVRGEARRTEATRTATMLTGEAVQMQDFSAPGPSVVETVAPRKHRGRERKRPATTLTGEVVDTSDFSAPAPSPVVPPATRVTSDEPRVATTLTGEVVEVQDFSTPREASPAHVDAVQAPPPASDPSAPIMRITYCKTCGIQNEETATACRKCRQPLEIITEPLPDIKPLRRSWGFDVLGVSWIALGLAAAYCGRFVVKADPSHPGMTWADYFWTGLVVCAPGVLIFMRHWFCKFTFWAMTFAATLIWAIIGFIWLYIGLHVSDNGRVGLMWFAALSVLSFISYVTVRLNDEFDVGA
ncbi:MAG: hypothetical protein FJX72_12290 [Armatimonadetes bacterium]|nr:hypothetical protein [Armatimonadota bacterium]